VRASADQARASASRQAYLWQSAACDSFWMQRCGDRIDKGALARARLEKEGAEQAEAGGGEDGNKTEEGGAAAAGGPAARRSCASCGASPSA